jgi:hypothetical protein
MNDLRKLAQAVRSEVPGAEIKLDEPERTGQAGWLDIEYEDVAIAVEWRPAVGFGVSRLEVGGDPTAGLFEGPDDVFSDLGEAKSHILLLLQPGLAERKRARGR